MNYIKLSIMCSFLMGLSLPYAEAMEVEVLSSSEEKPMFCTHATTHYTPPSQSQFYRSSSTQEYSQNTQNFLSGSGPYSQGSSYDSQSSQGTLPCAVPIYSTKPLKEQVERLIDKEGVNPENICVIFDFHGVIVEQERHKLPLTLKGDIIKTLEYLQTKKVPYLVATAWDNFNAVTKDGSAVLDLTKYFGVRSNQETKSEKYSLGPYKNKVELEGCRNGNFVALRYPLNEEEAQKERNKEEHYYYGQKAFSPELVFPEHKITHLFFVDDSQFNFETFRNDFDKISGKPANLYLYLLSKLF